MSSFENNWRNKVKKNTFIYGNQEALELIEAINEEDQILYSKLLIEIFEKELASSSTKDIFLNSACHLPHEYLENAKNEYNNTSSIEKARQVLEDEFKARISDNKELSISQLNYIIKNGFGAAGIIKDSKIIATKIPSMFHEYFKAEDENKKYYYCHCPRIRKDLINNPTLSSTYCNCGAGFYKDIWEYITGLKVEVKILKSLFDNNEVCSFEIKIDEIKAKTESNR